MVPQPYTGRSQSGRGHPLKALLVHGQSVWLDYITRSLVRGGDLQRLIEQDGLRGMTSNPTIFQKAVTTSDAYDHQIQQLARAGQSALAIMEALVVNDIQEACDCFLPLYNRTVGQDGFVSIEVSPHFAHDTEATINEAHRLWHAVNRPNLMVKVPGTQAGAPAVERLLREGINVNVTLLFSTQNHERVLWKYIEALEERVARGLPVDRIASVASFFVSRVDTLVDGMLEAQLTQATDNMQRDRLRQLLGKAAIANAKVAYARFREIFAGERFQRLRRHGARLQRVLWASTSTKNPDYPDVYYIEGLVGPYTINSMPLATLEAFKDHGTVQRTLDERVNGALATMVLLEQVGIDYDAITQQLENEGVEQFVRSYDDLLAGIEEKRAQMVS